MEEGEGIEAASFGIAVFKDGLNFRPAKHSGVDGELVDRPVEVADGERMTLGWQSPVAQFPRSSVPHPQSQRGDRRVRDLSRRAQSFGDSDPV